MRIRHLFSVTAILMIGFGLGFLLIPVPLFNIYGVQLTASGVMLAHVSGAAVGALGTLAWGARALEESRSQRVALAALAVFFILKSTVTLLAQLSGVFNALGWSILALDVPLAALYLVALWQASRVQDVGAAFSETQSVEPRDDR
jgi:hypothetical protein